MKASEPHEIKDDLFTEQIKAAFGPLQAEPALKEKTKLYIAEQIAARDKQAAAPVRSVSRPRWVLRTAAVLAALLLVMGLSSVWGSYQTQVAAISVDGTTSVELGLNRYERVISVKHFGSDNELPQWLAQLQLKNRRYNEAVALLLGNQELEQAFGPEAELELTVVSETGDEQELLTGLQKLTAEKQQRARVFAGNRNTMQEARKLGLSAGKYRVYCALMECGLEMSTEDLQKLSMAEIEQVLAAYPLASHQGSGNGPGKAAGTGAGAGDGTGAGDGSDSGSPGGKGQGGNGTGSGSPGGKWR